MSKFYTEGKASDHPDVAGQTEFKERADQELQRRRQERVKKAGPQLPGFLRKEEFELSEEEMTNPSGMKASMIKQYGPEKGEQVYFATIRKQAMGEALVEFGFAEDYDAADNMFDSLSEEFVEFIFEEYIEEAKRSRTERRAANAGRKGYDAKGKPVPRVSKTHIIHDVDDNVADQRHPDAAKIDLYKNNSGSYEHVKSMTPSEFAHTPLERKHTYGFNAFLKTKLFKDTTKKTKVAGMGDSPRRPAKKSVVTARGGAAFGSNKPSTPMDDPGSFAKDLRDRIGVRGLKRKDIHFTGGMGKGSNKGLSGPQKKGKLVSKIVDPSDKKIITTDDHLGNTRDMAGAASAAAPQSKVKAYQSRPSTRKPKGKGKVGDIVPSRVGKENKPGDPNIGIRANSDAPKTTKQTQRARKKAKKGMQMSSYDYGHFTKCLAPSQNLRGMLYYIENTGAPMVNEYPTHEEMLEIAAYREAENEKVEETSSYQATKDDFELWVGNLLDEGYDLSDYTWNELAECFTEAVATVRADEYFYDFASNKNLKEEVIEVELSPYEYWKENIR